MRTHADKTSDHKSRAAANSLPKQLSIGASAFPFMDNRPEAIAQRKLQEAITKSPRVQQLKVYQSMADVQKQLHRAIIPDNRPKPVQRLANRHGLTMPQYQATTGFTVLGWGRLTGPGIITNLNPVHAGVPGHAEDQLIVQANAVVAAAPPGTYTELEVWISSSPCSTGFGTRVGVVAGCLEDLQVFAAANGMIVRVHAQKPYQPRNMGPGMKQNSVNAANGAGLNVPHDFDTRTGIAAGLAPYVAPVGLPAGGLGTVAQLSGMKEEDKNTEEEKKSKAKVIVTYE